MAKQRKHWSETDSACRPADGNPKKILQVDGSFLWSVDGPRGKRVPIAIKCSTGRTDYPIFYDHNGTVGWDWPEAFSQAFRRRVSNVLLKHHREQYHGRSGLLGKKR